MDQVILGNSAGDYANKTSTYHKAPMTNHQGADEPSRRPLSPPRGESNPKFGWISHFHDKKISPSCTPNPNHTTSCTSRQISPVQTVLTPAHTGCTVDGGLVPDCVRRILHALVTGNPHMMKFITSIHAHQPCAPPHPLGKVPLISLTTIFFDPLNQ